MVASPVKTLFLPSLLLLHIHLLHLFIPSSAATYTNHTGALSPMVLCLPDQAAALLQLKRSFSVTNNSTAAFRSWKAGEDCCLWEGVRCGDADGRVTWLDLGDCGLESSRLDPALFELISLEYLNLGGNDFNVSEIPSTGFERLNNLTHLNLSTCNFAGQVPAQSIGQLTNLVSLDISFHSEIIEIWEDWREERWESRSDQRKGRRMGEWRTRLSQASRRRCFLPCSVAMAASICAGRRHRHQRWFRAQGRCRGGGGELLHNLHRHRFFVRPKHRSTSLEVFDGSYLFGGDFTHPWQLNLQNFTTLVANLSGLKELHLGFLDISEQQTDLPFCQLSSPIYESLSRLRSLSVIDLQYNFLTGPVPESFNNFSSLTVLQLRYNNLEGWVSPLIFQNKKLVVIDLHRNPVLSGTLPNFLVGSSLESLLVGHTNFSGTIPSSISNLKSFKELGLDASGFFGDLPSSIDLSFNMFEGPIPLPRDSGTVLDYSNNHFSSILPNISTQLRGTTYFKASRNNLSGNIPASFCTTNLQVLDLSYNFLSGSFPPCLMEDANVLQVLNLKQNQLHGELPHYINESCTIEAIDFSDNRIEGNLPRSLASCRKLEVLDIQNNQINDSFPCWMSVIPRLQVLILKSNKFFGQMTPTVAEESTCEFPSLRILDLASNNFSGTLKEEWFTRLKSMITDFGNETSVMEYEGDQKQIYQVTTVLTNKGSTIMMEKILRTFVFLDVSDNAFHGSIPKSMGELVLLHTLNMSHNSLTGPIPSQLGRLKQMEALDLSSNELSGVIPQELPSLDFLGMLNLSYNRLEGKIPESLHFSLFANSSFLGNDALCGPPLSKGCSNMTLPNVIPSEKKSVDVMLFLFSGIGFGLGFAIAIEHGEFPLEDATYTNHTGALPPAVPCLPDQASALLQLKRSFTITDDSTAAFRSWNAGKDCCRWEGVSCGDADGRVIWLDLGDCGLESNSLDPVLFKLTSLEYLNLGGNDFNESEIPSAGFERLSQVPVQSIGQLHSLVSLDISFSSDLIELFDHGYLINPWQMDLPNLTALVANLSSLRSLNVIDLQYNYLTGPIPEYFANLSSLSVLQLGYNKLEGWVSPSIFQNKKLVTIDLHRNPDLSGTLPNISADSSLESLLVGRTNFSGRIPSSISNIKSLKKLDLGASGFSGKLPSSIVRLDLSFNMFEGTIPLPQNSRFVLDYSNNRFSSIPTNISTQLGYTAYFKASRNNLSGEIPSSFCSNNIQVLDLSYNFFSGSIPSCLFEDANALKVLNLKQNQLHGELAHNINESCTLEALDFSDNRIEGNLPRSLVSCRKLEVLDIQNNQINDSFPCWMRVIPRLQVLILKSNKFFGQVTPTVAEESTCEFPSLRILDLASNNFSGTLSEAWFMRLKSMMIESTNETLVMEFEGDQQVYQVNIVLTYKGSAIAISKILRTFVFIDVSNNAFHGSIPESIGELVLLHALNMSHNSLTGPVPSPLGHLNQMEALDLSSNELSGVIPQELASLDFLGTLNLSYNMLEGKIPESPHFSLFSNSSFLGNDALCGPPLSKGCNNMTLLNVIPSQKKSVDVMLFLFSGIGFGLGFAIAIVIAWGFPIRRRSPARQRAL
uniref:Leucine-rich repeat-containing N-terminal plant-type domain-containing protein n=1 Tax=Oryza rufipogon TaxID=4529 RepID=A0A0E0MRN6_ORYRU